MLIDSDKKAVVGKSEMYFTLAERFFGRTFERAEYLFNQRGKAAGSAHLQRNLIKFNPILFKQDPCVFFDQVIPHEVAHLVVFQTYGKVRPHGIEWQRIMKTLFKRPALTTHNLNIDDVVGQQFAYACDCQQHKLTIRRHNKVLRGERYLCRRCRGLLKMC